jgi:hypothetical protein
MDETVKDSGLHLMAQRARARVAEALKSTVEREVLASEPDDLGHSKFDHVVAVIERAGQSEDLVASLWGSESEARIQEFASRLARQKAV